MMGETHIFRAHDLTVGNRRASRRADMKCSQFRNARPFLRTEVGKSIQKKKLNY